MVQELLDAEKEERRKKREEEAARKAKAELLKKAEGDTAAASKAGTPDASDAAELPNGTAAPEDTRSLDSHLTVRVLIICMGRKEPLYGAWLPTHFCDTCQDAAHGEIHSRHFDSSVMDNVGLL